MYISHSCSIVNIRVWFLDFSYKTDSEILSVAQHVCPTVMNACNRGIVAFALHDVQCVHLEKMYV